MQGGREGGNRVHGGSVQGAGREGGYRGEVHGAGKEGARREGIGCMVQGGRLVCDSWVCVRVGQGSYHSVKSVSLI